MSRGRKVFEISGLYSFLIDCMYLLKKSSTNSEIDERELAKLHASSKCSLSLRKDSYFQIFISN